MFSPNNEADSIDGKPLSELRVVDLKDQLEKRGLSKSGSKNVLIKRLRDSLALERDKEEQSTKDPDSAPNMEMKSCGSNIVAEYLEKQQQALQAAKKAAQAARAAAHDDSGSATGEEVAEPEVVGDDKNFNTEVEKAPSPAVNDDSGSANGEKVAEPEIFADDKDVITKVETPPRAAAHEDSNGATGEEVAEIVVNDKGLSTENEKSPCAASHDDSSGATGEEVAEPEVVADDRDFITKAEKSPPAAAAHDDSGSATGEEVAEPEIVADDKDFNTKVETLKTEKPQRKRKWGSTTVGKRNTVSISSDSLKEIVGNVKAPETIMASTLDEPVQLDYDEDPAPKRIVISREDMEEEETTTVVEVVPEKDEQLPEKEKKEKTKLILEPLTYDEGFIRERSPSPARHPVSRIIHVRCLTRPFTVKALQEFVGKFGNFSKEDFWIDNIKSHCFIKYDKEEDAVSAREKLDNIRWPLSNPNVLHVDFANQDDLDRHVNKTPKENDRQPRNSFQAENKVELHKPRERTVREISTNEIDNSKKPERNRSPKVNDYESKLWSKSREWDKGKESWRNGKSPPRREERRRSRSPSHKRNDIKQQEVAPVKLLEDLFRKTKATPCLYWLPLSQEQINEKEKQRSRRAMERNERLKQMTKYEERERERRRDKEREREKEKSGRDHRRPEEASSRHTALPHRRR